ncbi:MULTISPECIES: amino acid ABC transporter permease [unclassified Stappia]|uniref:amino acid ABC transporter permease n=1 Tax=unclassified Stappia TaxID=2629676 RepID=UPI001643A8EE|nr:MULTISPECIES: amino acid ABC transporter permease [unclassified Stappia]
MIDLFIRAWPLLVSGTVLTVVLGVVSFLLALPIGLGLAVARLYGPRLLRVPARIAVSFLCGTPLLVQILLLYYGLPQVGVVLPAIPTVIAAFALHSGAFIGEDLRGVIGSVEPGQWDAGASLGLKPALVLFLIVLPQALRAAIPTLGTRFIGAVKETSLASVVTVVELTRVAEKVGSSSFRYLEMFVIAAAIYWALSFAIARLQQVIESRFATCDVTGSSRRAAPQRMASVT